MNDYSHTRDEVMEARLRKSIEIAKAKSAEADAALVALESESAAVTVEQWKALRPRPVITPGGWPTGLQTCAICTNRLPV